MPREDENINDTSHHRFTGGRATFIVRTFKVTDAPCSGPLLMGGVPGWDSLGHMQLVVELENEFDVTFPTYHLAELVDEAAIAHVIEQLQAGK